MKLRFLFLVILTAILLEGCFSFSVRGWHKQGVSEYETENTLAQCEYEAAGGNNQNNRGDFVNNCMKRQGFRWY